MSDWADNFLDKALGPFIVIMIGGVALFTVVAIYAIATDRSREDFMTECQHDHKQYECSAMWRAGHSTTTVVPMPVILPAAR